MFEICLNVYLIYIWMCMICWKNICMYIRNTYSFIYIIYLLRLLRTLSPKKTQSSVNSFVVAGRIHGTSPVIFTTALTTIKVNHIYYRIDPLNPPRKLVLL